MMMKTVRCYQLYHGDAAESLANTDIKPYIITPYIVSTSRPGSTEPHVRTHSPESELEVPALPCDAPPPSHGATTPHADDSGPGAWIEIEIHEHERATIPPVAGASGVASPTPSNTLRQITSPAPSIALGPTRPGGDYSPLHPAMRTSGLALATAGLAFVTSELKEKTKRKRKSKIHSVPRPKSFCIDKSRTGHSPTGTEDVPPPLPSAAPPPLPSTSRISR